MIGKPLRLASRRLLGKQPLETVRYRVELRRHAVRLGHGSWLTPRPEHPPVVILCDPRTGSTLLRALLVGLDGVGFSLHGEVLSPSQRYGAPGLAFRWRALRHIEWYFAAQDGSAGAKLHAAHLERCGLSARDVVTRWPDARYLVLFRRRLGDMYVSDRLARISGQWVMRGGEDRRPRLVFHADRSHLERFIDQERRRFDEMILATTACRHRGVVAYEDLAADPQRVFDDVVFPALDLPPARLTTDRPTRQRDYEMSEVVTNHREVADLLDTVYEPPREQAPSRTSGG